MLLEDYASFFGGAMMPGHSVRGFINTQEQNINTSNGYLQCPAQRSKQFSLLF
jgi:hypothetical protein